MAAVRQPVDFLPPAPLGGSCQTACKEVPHITPLNAKSYSRPFPQTSLMTAGWTEDRAGFSAFRRCQTKFCFLTLAGCRCRLAQQCSLFPELVSPWTQRFLGGTGVGCGHQRERHRSKFRLGRCGSLRSPHPTGLYWEGRRPPCHLLMDRQDAGPTEQLRAGTPRETPCLR